MTTEIKYLVFKGVEKREQILFKSFLNLAKNELDYQILILKENDTSGEAPSIVILDAGYEFDEEEAELRKLPTIRVGKELSNAANYISRPVQWSDFKSALSGLDMDGTGELVQSEERVLPDEMEFVIAEMDEKSEQTVEEVADDFDAAEEYDYELDNLSIDYHSFTNSEYLKVVDDVKGFKDGEEGAEDVPQAVVLVTDDESASNNSVLVIETNSLDAWEMSEADLDSEISEISENVLESDSAYADSKKEEQLNEILGKGDVIQPGDEFWNDQVQVYSGRDQLMFIKPDEDMVYSDKEPGKWTLPLRGKQITKLALDNNWTPTENLKAYPMSRLLWANTIANKGGGLISGLDMQTEYILERWPHFDLLELDNMLLKLCTMLFVSTESPYSLMQKSGYSRTVVFGLVNACQEMGILRNATEIDLEKFSEMSNDEGVFGKIKDVFRS